MNYRHIFHAGNRCDVAKHSILMLVLKHLREKEKGFAVLDTHAGTGLYDLADPRAEKTGEAVEGIKSLLAAAPIPALADYYRVLKELNPLWNQSGFRVYAGSPLFIYHLSRKQDRLIVCELHPEEARVLRLQMPDDSRLQIHCRDGYEALGAFLPPVEKRGLVLIDPPYEQPNEFEVLLKNLVEAHRRWPTGTYMIWYPIKDRPAIWKFHEALAATGIKKILRADFIYEAETRTDFLSGSGMVIINPPWKLDEELLDLFPALHKAMGTAYAEDAISWITSES